LYLAAPLEMPTTNHFGNIFSQVTTIFDLRPWPSNLHLTSIQTSMSQVIQFKSYCLDLQTPDQLHH